MRKGGIGAQPHRKIAAPAASVQGARRKGGARPDRPVKIKKRKSRAAEPHDIWQGWQRVGRRSRTIFGTRGGSRGAQPPAIG